jgi:hypothetical protein
MVRLLDRKVERMVRLLEKEVKKIKEGRENDPSFGEKAEEMVRF